MSEYPPGHRTLISSEPDNGPIAPPLPLSVEGAAAQVNTRDFSTVEKDFDICVIRV